MIDPDDDACIFYTSGTTGTPKGAQLTHRGCVANLMNIGFGKAVQEGALDKAGVKSKGRMGAEEVNVALVATPLFHVTGNNCVAQGIAATGGKLIHMYKWDAAEALRIIEAEKVTAFSAVPMMSREMLIHPDFPDRDTSSLKTMGGGGAAVQPDLTKKMHDEMENAAPSAGYGMTETCGIISASVRQLPGRQARQCGSSYADLRGEVCGWGGQRGRQGRYRGTLGAWCLRHQGLPESAGSHRRDHY